MCIVFLPKQLIGMFGFPIQSRRALAISQNQILLFAIRVTKLYNFYIHIQGHSIHNNQVISVVDNCFGKTRKYRYMFVGVDRPR